MSHTSTTQDARCCEAPFNRPKHPPAPSHPSPGPASGHADMTHSQTHKSMTMQDSQHTRDCRLRLALCNSRRPPAAEKANFAAICARRSTSSQHLKIRGLGCCTRFTCSNKARSTHLPNAARVRSRRAREQHNPREVSTARIQQPPARQSTHRYQ